LRAGRRKVHKILVARGSSERGALGDIVNAAQRAGVPVTRVATGELASQGGPTHGVAAVVEGYPYAALAEVLDRAAILDEDPLVLIMDALQDPQNLGTLLRTADAVGVHGAILPYRGGVGVTPAVVAASAGACEHMLIVGANLAQAMATLKDAGLWIVGLDAGGEASPLEPDRLRGPLALVVGNEGRGLRRLVRESCDFTITLPRRGAVESLNAAVAGSIVLYEAYRARQEPDGHGGPAGRKRAGGN
jgi:23S rRNA (guanosine2251-2'-O)-methyltransferase